MRQLQCVILTLVATIAAYCQTVIVQSPAFRSVYDLRLQCPQQVTWTVRQSDIGEAKREPAWLFYNSINSPLATATHADFNKSGYDRGHMCPAADKSTDLYLMRSTFDLANVAPQIPGLNRGAWKKTESFCRSAALIYDSVEVLALPIFLNRDTSFIGSHRLAVPHAFIKAAWLPQNDSVIGLWFYWNR